MPQMTLDARPREAGRFALWRGLCGRISGHSQTDVVSLNAAGDLPYEDYGGLIDRPVGIERIRGEDPDGDMEASRYAALLPAQR